jgi:hypothetical protein
MGGFCEVASAVACLNFFFGFIALRGCIGADGAYAGAAITFCPCEPRSHAGSTRTFAPSDWRGTAGDGPWCGNAGTSRGRRGAAGDRSRSRTGAASSGYEASDHQSHCTEA